RGEGLRFRGCFHSQSPFNAIWTGGYGLMKAQRRRGSKAQSGPPQSTLLAAGRWATLSLCALEPLRPSHTPLQNLIDRTVRHRVIHRSRFRVDRARTCESFRCLGKLLVQRLEELAASLPQEKALQRRVRGLVLVIDCLQQPLMEDLGVPAVGEVERGVEPGHLLARERLREMAEEVDPFVR